MKLFSWLKTIFRRRKSYGLVPQDPDPRDYQYRVSGSPIPECASAFNEGEEITYQNGYGSCVAHSAGDVLTNEVLKLIPPYVQNWASFRCSEAFIWYVTRLQEGAQDENVGVVARNAFKAIKKYGFVGRSQWDYKDGPYQQPPQAVFDLALAHAMLMDYFPDYVAISKYDSSRTVLIMDAIAQKHKISLAIPVYQSFEDYSGGVIEEFSGKLKGYHDVVIGEYYLDDQGRTIFKGKNSWGPQWGEKGFFRITEEILKALAFDMWTFQKPEEKNSTEE